MCEKNIRFCILRTLSLHFGSETVSRTVYHGTSLETAEIIRREGFKPSSDGLLGPGTYVARADKASKFAANCPRHGGSSGAVVKVRISFTRAKFVSFNDHVWLSEGYDACRAERTSMSPYPEWCLKSPSQVEVLEVRPIACGATLPAFEGEAMSLDVVRAKARQLGLEEVYFCRDLAVVAFASDAANPLQALIHCSAPKRPALGGSPRQWTNRHGPALDEEAAVRGALERLRREVSEAEAVLEDHKQRREEEARRQAEERKRQEEEQQRKAAEEAAELARQEAERQRQEEAARIAAASAALAAANAEKARVRTFRGTRCCFVIDSDHACEEMRKRQNSIESVTDLTLVGDGFFLARENGDSFWTRLPENLEARLREKDLWTKGAVKIRGGRSRRSILG